MAKDKGRMYEEYSVLRRDVAEVGDEQIFFPEMSQLGGRAIRELGVDKYMGLETHRRKTEESQ